MDGGLERFTTERFATGDVDAFEMLFRQYQGEVYRCIARIVRDRGAAEELMIETFWRIYHQRQRFDAQRSFGQWARRIATRVAIDYLRSGVQPLEPLGQQGRRAQATADNQADAQAADPVQQGEIRERIERAFGLLPARLRAAAA